MRMASNVTVSATEQFSTVRRGFDPSEVARYVERVNKELLAAKISATTAADQLSALQNASAQAQAEATQARAELESLQAEAAQLRAELDKQSAQPLTMSALSARMQRLLQIAEEEAAEIRSAADRYSQDTRSKTDADTDSQRKAASEQVSKLRADAEREMTSLRDDLAAEIDAARAEIAADRSELDQTRTAVYEQAKRLMTEAHSDAEKTLAEARERAEHLSAAAAADRAKQEEDYELAIESRRRQAHRAIVEAEQTSRADAQHRIDQANTHARNIVESANAHAEDLLRRAASESHQRVAEADEAVRKLINLRSELQQQILDLSGRLADLSNAMVAVRKTLEPLPLEAQRPRAEAFPAEPEIKTQGTAAYTSAPPQWHPPAPPVSLAWEKVSAQLEQGDHPASDPTPVDGSAGRDADEAAPDTGVDEAQPVDDAGAGADNAGSPSAEAEEENSGSAEGFQILAPDNTPPTGREKKLADPAASDN